MPDFDSMTETELREYLNKQRETPQFNISFKIGDKGGVSVYGLQRFPVTLYAPQWLALLEKAEELKKFIEQNKSRLQWGRK